MTPFSKILADPDYQALPDEDKMTVRRGYYRQVAGDEDFKLVSDEEKQTLGRSILFPGAIDRPPTPTEFLGEQIGKGARGVIDTWREAGSAIAKGAGELVSLGKRGAERVADVASRAVEPIVEDVREFARDPRTAATRKRPDILSPENRAAFNRGLEHLFPNIPEATREIVKGYPAEERRTQEVLRPVLGRFAEPAGRALSAGRTLLGLPFVAVPPVVQETLVSPAIEAVKQAGEAAPAELAPPFLRHKVPEDVSKVIGEIAPDLLMIFGPAVFRRRYGRAPRNREEIIRAAREEPAFVDEIRGIRRREPEAVRPREEPVSPAESVSADDFKLGTEQPIAPRRTRPTRVKPEEDLALSEFVRRQGGIRITDDIPGELRSLTKENKRAATLLRKDRTKGIATEEMAELAFDRGYIAEPTTDALLGALREDLRGKKVLSREKAARVDDERLRRQDIERQAEDKITDLTQTRQPMEFEGHRFDEAERVPGGVRLKDDVDVTLKKAEDILSVERRPTAAVKPPGQFFKTQDKEFVPKDQFPDPFRYGTHGADATKSRARDASGALWESTGYNVGGYQIIKKIKDAEPKPIFERTQAGEQGVIPGAEGRSVPTGGLRGRGRQTEELTELERVTMRGEEPELFGRRGAAAADDIPFDIPEPGPEFEPGSAGFPASRRSRVRGRSSGLPEENFRRTSGSPGQKTAGDVPYADREAATDNPFKPGFLKRIFRGPEKQLVGRADIVRELSERLEVPIRTGRHPFKQAKALAVFKIKEEVIRNKLANAVEETAHEVGHFLSKKVLGYRYSGKKSGGRAFDKELVMLGRELYGNRKPNFGGYAEEGIAEFVRFYIANPEKARTKAPNFYKEFERVLKEDFPDVGRVLIKARRDVRRYNEQTSTQRVLSEISIGEKAKTHSFSFDDLYTAFIDDLNPVKVYTDAMRQKKPLPFDENPYGLARLIRGLGGKIDEWLDHGTTDWNTLKVNGKSLRAILEPVKDRLDDFRAYLVDRRTLELLSRGKESGITKGDALASLKELEAKYSDFPRLAQDLYAYNDRLLTYLRDSGVLDERAYLQIRELNKDYVPFYRLFDESDPGPAVGGGRSRMANLSQPLKRIKGSGRPIADPLESTIKNTYAYLSLAERNNVMRQLVKLAGESEGAGKYVERVIQEEKIIQVTKSLELDLPAYITEIFRPQVNAPRGENIVTVLDGGRKSFYQLHPELYRASLALDSQGANWLSEMLNSPKTYERAIGHALSGPAKTLRLGATVLSPEFWIRNPARDQLSAWLFTKYGYKPRRDFLQGLFHLAKKDEWYHAWRRAGGDQAAMLSVDRPQLQKNLQELLEGRGQRLKPANIVRHPIDATRLLVDLARVATELGEAPTRIGEFQRALKSKGLTPETASRADLLEAGFAAREVTLDFARAGARMRGFSQMTAFLNPNVQGIDKMFRAIKENPARVLTKAFVGITLPSIYLYLANRDDPRYQELPRWQKNFFWIVPTGEMTTERWSRMTSEEKAKFSAEHTIWRIPKPFEAGQFFGTLPELILEYIDKRDPKAIEDMWGMLEQSVPNVMPTTALPLLENMMNYSFFRERPLISRSKERVEPSQQFTPFTSETAKLIGKTTNLSPVKIENVIRGWAGGAGKAALSLADLGLETVRGEKRPAEPEKRASDIPMVRAFVARDPDSNAESIERFYQKLEKAEVAYNTFNAMKRQGETQEAERYRQEHRGEISEHSRLRAIARDLSEIRKRADRIRQSRDLEPGEKRNQLDALTIRMIELARRGFKRPSSRSEIEERFGLRPSRTPTLEELGLR